MRESLKSKRAEVKQVEKEITKLEVKKAKADAKAAEEAKKTEAESMVKRLLASGMSADEILGIICRLHFSIFRMLKYLKHNH